jgi:hypothetical protein
MAINGFEAGELVVCDYRMPSVQQPWIHPIYVGAIEEPGDDPATWNRHNSERHYCEVTGTVPVCYEGEWRQHDRADSLIRITPEEAAMTHPEKVARFLGQEALANYERASLPSSVATPTPSA